MTRSLPSSKRVFAEPQGGGGRLAAGFRRAAHPCPPASLERRSLMKGRSPFVDQRKLWTQERQSQNAALAKDMADSQTLSKDGMDVAEVDPLFLEHEEHLKYRYKQFVDTKAAIERAEGSLANFANGYERFGLCVGRDATTYREWAPGATAAQLIGDFNGWAGTELQRDEFGVWSVSLPHGPGGVPAIAHRSRVKVRLRHPTGQWLDRVPAWIAWATVPLGQMGAKYDGIMWNPPAGERHAWQHARPPRPRSLRIYEAHVGMSSEEPRVASYTYFKDQVLPRIAGLGYNAVQLMAVQEHAYYGSFGYHVTSPFAASSRSGTPEELKALVDRAHGLGLLVLLDVVHSHVSSNADDGIAGFDLGQSEDQSYFCAGERGYHSLWDSRLFNYRNWEVLRFLLSNLRWWLEEYRFDGFRFDGVTSMLYWHHGINLSFSGDYAEYFSPATNTDAVVYLMLANALVRTLLPSAVTVAEDVSGMPTLGLPVARGGVGFDFRLAMGLPDLWLRLLKQRDEAWDMGVLAGALTNRRYSEGTIAYVESHDQCIVGDQTLAFRLMGAEMYSGMSALAPPSPVIERGCALHMLARAVTMVLGGEGWLGFMGNEFGHPEWVDFPREGNGWSYEHCRRKWSLVDSEHLRYRHLNAWDAALQKLDQQYSFLTAAHQIVSSAGQGAEQVLVAERGDLVFVFNFSPTNSLEGYKVGTPASGKFRVVLDSDEARFGGRSRIGHGVDHFTSPEGTPGVPEGNFNNRAFSMLVAAPARTVAVYAQVPEDPAIIAAARAGS